MIVDDKMGFIQYLTKFTKQIFFFVGGFIVAIPVGGLTMHIGSTVEYHPLPETIFNPFFVIIGIILFIVGLAMMGYSFKIKR